MTGSTEAPCLICGHSTAERDDRRRARHLSTACPRPSVYVLGPIPWPWCSSCDDHVLPSHVCPRRESPLLSHGGGKVGSSESQSRGIAAPDPRESGGRSRSRGESAPAPANLRQSFRRPRARHVAFVAVGAATPVADALRVVSEGAERVYLVGPRPGGGDAAGARSWACGELPAGWSLASAPWVDGPNTVYRFAAPWGDVELHRAAAWFGEGDYSVAVAEHAWNFLGDLIRARLRDERFVLQSTPSVTGRDLLLRSLPRDHEFAPLGDDLQTLIRSTSGQARTQTIDRGPLEIPALVELDARLAYAAVAWGLGRGPATHDHGDAYEERRRGRYRVRFVVPRDWSRSCVCGAPGHDGIGLLPVKDPRRRERDGWLWPASPGERGETWVDGAELHVAYRHGWSIDIRERVLLADERSGPDPLRKWRDRLVAFADVFDHGDAPAEVAPLGRAAVRAMIVATIGALHGAPYHRAAFAPVDRPDLVPRGVVPIRDGDAFTWTTTEPARWPAMSHPEWSSAIWARQRARLLSGPAATGALHVPAESVVAFRTDALALTFDPGWPYAGKPGQFRTKAVVRGPIAAPRTNNQFLAARQKG